MRIHLIKKQAIEDFVRRNAQSRTSFEVWKSKIKKADWNNPKDILTTFNRADILGKGTERVVLILGVISIE